MEAVLYISSHDLSPRSICHCKQELKLVDTAKAQCTVNGEILKLKGSQKLWTRIVCQDPHPSHSLDLELGTIIKIGSIQRLWKKVTPGKVIKLKHVACDNSIQGHDRQGQIICHLMGDQEICIPDNVEFISYRPWLDMMVTDIQIPSQNWNTICEWSLEAEEI